MSHYVSKKRDARTTQRQYELMLDFMIKHPDIASGRHANTKRANYEKHWEELAHVLNSDTAGPSKATSKWMKCWSDWKHNTRTKSAKIRQFKETPADGRFPCLLTSLEERLLKLMASFKNETSESFICKQEPFDGCPDYEIGIGSDLRSFITQVQQYPFKQEVEDPEEDMSEDSSDDDTPFNTADFCIPVIAQDDEQLPNVEIKSGNGLSSSVSIETWKKRKRLYSDTSSHEYQANNSDATKIINIDTTNNDDNVRIRDTLSRIANAVEQSAKANERCANACERIANLCERVTSACERSINLNEKLVSVYDRNVKLHERNLLTTEAIQKTTERHAESTDKLVEIVQSVAEQSFDVIKKYIGQNSIRR